MGYTCEAATGEIHEGTMTEALEKVFGEVAKLPAEQQDALAAWIAEQLESERRWDAAFAASADELGKLADEALAERRAGLTEELDPEKL